MSTTKSPDSEDRLVPPAEAASRLDLSRAHLAKLRMRGDGPPFVKLGAGKTGRVRYRLSDIEKWIVTRTRNSTSDLREAG